MNDQCLPISYIVRSAPPNLALKAGHISSTKHHGAHRMVNQAKIRARKIDATAPEKQNVCSRQRE